MSSLLIWYDYDNAVRHPKFGRGRLDLRRSSRCRRRQSKILTCYAILNLLSTLFNYCLHSQVLCLKIHMPPLHMHLIHPFPESQLNTNIAKRHGVIHGNTGQLYPNFQVVGSCSCLACAEMVVSDWSVRGSCASQSQVGMQLQ